MYRNNVYFTLILVMLSKNKQTSTEWISYLAHKLSARHVLLYFYYYCVLGLNNRTISNSSDVMDSVKRYYIALVGQGEFVHHC